MLTVAAFSSAGCAGECSE